MGIRNLLVNVGLAAAKAGAKFDPSGIAANLLDRYDKQQLRHELEELLRARFALFKDEVAGAMADMKLDVADGSRAQVEAYLCQFQASARAAARVLGDPSATTVPLTVGVDDAVQLAAFLPQRPPRFAVGDAVPGLRSWTLAEPLGAGGFGEVWRAENPYVGAAAFKFFLDPLARSRFTRAEALALAEILKKAPTDGVVKLLNAEPEQDPPWLQFEYVSGGDLSSLPEAWKGLAGAERADRAHGVVRALAATAGHFHKLGVVHRDLKPSNILVRENGAPVVADFGISKIVPVGAALATPANSGTATIRAYTALYASPQQKKFQPADRRDDVYALGVLWYQLLRGDLTLERPSGEGWKRALARQGVSDEVVALLNRCWDDEPDDRPADGNELAVELDKLRRAWRDTVPAEVATRERVAAQRKPGEEVHVALPGNVRMTFCWVPPGSAQLGAPEAEVRAVAAQMGGSSDALEAEAEKYRGVYATPGFWLGKYPVTQAEWRAVTGGTPSSFRADGAWASLVHGINTWQFPVESVSWDLVTQAFLPTLNAVAAGDVFGQPGRFVLPHENQWEYACRGGLGNARAYHWGAALGGAEANVDGEFPFATSAKGPKLGRPSPVGVYAAKHPHPWGLCEMHGNVWEWCENLYHSHNYRLLRGGSWFNRAHFARSACRSSFQPHEAHANVGFRVLFQPAG